MAEKVYTLQSATFDFYATDENGAAVGDAIFIGVCAESVRLIYRFEEIIKRPTGRKYPRARHLSEEHEISMERVWVIDGPEFAMEHNKRYVMVITWIHHQSNETVSRTYYGVTNRSNDLGTREVEFTNSQSFRAEYFLPG